MVELHGLWTLPPALRIAEALKPYDVAWLEEPIRFNELDAMAELARHTSIPIAASERLATRQMFKQLIDKRAASIIMIDLAWCGGLSEARKIANMAEASELPVTLHDCTGPVVFAASCALSATLPNVNWQEAVRAYFTGWYTRDRGCPAAGRERPGVPARRARPRPQAEAGGVRPRRRRRSACPDGLAASALERHERQALRRRARRMANSPPACGWPVRSRGRATERRRGDVKRVEILAAELAAGRQVGRAASMVAHELALPGS